MSESDSPISIPITMNPRVELLDKANGAIIGWLAFDSGGAGFVRCDQNFSNCHTISTKFLVIREANFFAGFVILSDGSSLYSYNIITNEISSAIHKFLGPPSIHSPFSDFIQTSDDTYLYFVDGNTIFKVPFDGSTNAVSIATEAESIRGIGLTDNSVIYSVLNNIRAVSKQDGTLKTLVSRFPPGPAISTVQLITTGGPWIYYEVANFSSSGSFVESFTAGSINENSADRREILDGKWVGATQNTEWKGKITSSSQGPILRTSSSKILLASGCSADFFGCAFATIKSFDAPRNSGEVTLGTLPIDIVSIFVIGRGDVSLLGGRARVNNFTRETDIFFINTKVTNSLVRVTNTPTKGESFDF